MITAMVVYFDGILVIRDTGRFTGGLEVMYRPRQAAELIYVVFKYFSYIAGYFVICGSRIMYRHCIRAW